MSEWKAKRFWKQATVDAAEGGFAVFLDGRPVKTPAKAALILPTHAMAVAMAAEWDAQEGRINPEAMPVTRSANAAIDKVAPQIDAVVEIIADYGDADLLCYRATTPEELVALQAASWDPLLDWAATSLNAPLSPVSGIIHRPQDPASLARLRALVQRQSAFELAGFHDLVALSGSLILGFAALLDHLSPDQLWDLSRLDEDWQEKQWGRDDDAHAAAQVKRAAFLHAKRFCDLAKNTS